MSEARTGLDENSGVAPFTTFSDVIAEFDHVDDPDVFERMKTTPVAARQKGLDRFWFLW